MLPNHRQTLGPHPTDRQPRHPDGPEQNEFAAADRSRCLVDSVEIAKKSNDSDNEHPETNAVPAVVVIVIVYE